ncbi:DNA-processing protein DprA [Candidatus Williamhamiltonella defendens]|uniref:DNA-processing protein DprA n=1 Tax=Candidatus Williamhamiltonella defendens TaxID=138072 RepID=UPI0022A7B104|nr:DNA-processing protein DprA [Candidatus Hamiltonella defensa]
MILTSRLAIGIDSICYQSALNLTGKTIAVLGSGLENIYHRRHCDLARRIREEGGTIVSEFLTTTLPLSQISQE